MLVSILLYNMKSWTNEQPDEWTMVFQKKQPGVTEPLENPYNLMKSRKESPSYRNFQLLINILNGVHVQAGWIIIP